jgi:hypothetical protein
MFDFVEWNPKRHGQKPPYWLPDMLTSVDGKNFARQPNWAWIAGSTYYVPREAVELPRIEPDPEQTDELVKRLRDEDEGGWVAGLCNQAADRLEALAAENELLRKALGLIALGSIIELDDEDVPVQVWFDDEDMRSIARAALEKQP